MSDDTIVQYLDFIKEYGLPYGYSDVMRIITDYDELMKYSVSHDREIGLIYKDDYNIFVVDLVENVRGERFTYDRIVKTRRGNSVVVIPSYNDKFVLLKQFRHAVGDYQYSFPRGYGEPDITIEENAKKEIAEELNAAASSVSMIGQVIADSGICGEKVNVLHCVVDNIYVDGIYEGIRDYIVLSSGEIDDFIKSDMITDGFTLSAWALFKSKMT